MREYLEANYKDDLNDEQAVRMAVETLLEVVEGADNLDVCVIKDNNSNKMVDEEKLNNIYKEMKAEKEAAEAAKKKKKE